MTTAEDMPADRTKRVSELKQAMKGAIRAFRLDDAKAVYAELTDQLGVDPEADDMLPPRVQIGVLGGRKLEMLQLLNGLDEDRAPGLKAICLQLVGDPLWEGIALQVEQMTGDPDIRRSMQALLKASKPRARATT